MRSKTGKKIQDPVLGTTDNVRVYGQIMDWIPEYNSSTPAKISFGITNPQDLEIKAAYVVIGEAEKTPQLLALDIHPMDSNSLSHPCRSKVIVSNSVLPDLKPNS